jgi:uncharacterized protein
MARTTATAPAQDPRHVSPEFIAGFARRRGLRRIVLFGSAARGHMRPNSDVDVAFESAPGATISLFDQVRMRDELTELFGRPVDLVTLGGLKGSARADADRDAVVLYEGR